MAVQYDPIAKDESFNTTESTPRNLADVLAEGIGDLVSAISQIAPQTTYDELDKLNDVQITSATSGQVLKWNGSKWVNANESGGSGGHTIEDSTGTALTQRTNLQFKGARTSDDSVNDRTVVDVSDEEIEWSVWDAMSTAQQDAYLLQHPNLIVKNAPDTTGSVTVYGDGVKTYSQVLDNLYALIDQSKITPKTILLALNTYYQLSAHIVGSLIRFTGITANESNIYATCINVKASSSAVYSSTGTSVSNISSTVIGNGTVFTLYY